MIAKTILEIDKILSRVNTHPEYSACVAREKHHALMGEAERHSLELELKVGADPRYSDRNHTKILRDLNEAGEFLAREGMSGYSLSSLGHIIEPKNQPFKIFRNVDLIFGKQDFPGSSKGKIFFEIDNLIYLLENFERHPIVRAANAHIEMVRIHPYEDGNGRAARLLQNFCLQERGYPPAIIEIGCKKDYLRLMEGVLKDRIFNKSSVHKPSESENEFNDFIAFRVLASARDLEEELKIKRIYSVSLKKLDNPSLAKNVASVIRGHGRVNGNSGVCVSINKKNEKKKVERLDIVGDISAKDIEGVLEKYSKKYDFRYDLKISPKNCS